MKWRRQELRKNCTETEKILWSQLKQRKIGAKFIRQYSIGNWVVDFYCPEYKLVIELDGGIHKGLLKADKYRNELLEGMGLRVLRFKNEEVLNNINEVLEKIRINITYPD